MNTRLVRGIIVESIGVTEQRLEEYFVKVGNETAATLPHDIDSIFDRFYTADQSRSGQSMGLGLYISRKLINGMGGMIWAKKDGQRLFVTVKLPMDNTSSSGSPV